MLFHSLFKKLTTEVIRTERKSLNTNELIAKIQLNPELIAIKLVGENEQEIVDLINSYVKFVNRLLLEQIKTKGIKNIALEKELIQQKMINLREGAKVRREFLIAQIEESNKEKLAKLRNEKRLLLIKTIKDKEAKIARLEEAYGIAKTMGIKKLTTIDAMATENKSSKTLISLGGKNQQIHALLGTIYLNSELEALRNRNNDELFIPGYSELNKQIESLENDERLHTLKMRDTDDPFITELPDLILKLNKLNQISFNFDEAKLYRLDKQAIATGDAVKPSRKLIVSIVFLLSFFASIFIVLILNAVRNHGEKE